VHKAYNEIDQRICWGNNIDYENWNLKYGKWNNRSAKKCDSKIDNRDVIPNDLLLILYKAFKSKTNVEICSDDQMSVKYLYWNKFIRGLVPYIEV